MADNLMESLMPDEREALSRAIMAAGFGLLGTRKGNEMGGLGRAGLLGMSVYDNSLEDQLKKNVTKLSLAQHVAEMQAKQQMANDQQGALSALSRMPPPPGTVGPPKQFQQPGGAAALVNGATGGDMPSPVAMATQQAAPPDDPAAQKLAQATYLEHQALQSNPPNATWYQLAQKLREEAMKMRDENQGFETVMGPNGPQVVQRRKFGAPQVMPYGPKPEMTLQDLGGSVQAIDKLRLPSGQTFNKTMDPGQADASKRGWAGLAQAERHFQNAPGQVIETQGGYARLGKDNSVTPIMTDAGQLQPKPTGAIAQQIASNTVTLSKVDKALNMVQSNPGAFGVKNYLGDTVRQRTDPGGVTGRAIIADIAGQKIHDRSGAAVTVGEAERLKPYVPNVTDTPETILKKLSLFKSEYIQMQRELMGGKSLSEVTMPKDNTSSGVIDFSQLPK